MPKRKRTNPANYSRRTAAQSVRTVVRLEEDNFLLLGLGLLALAVGFLLLSRGSVVAAPLFLFLGYVVLIPLGLIRKRRRAADEARADG